MPRELKFRAWNMLTKTMIDLKKYTPLALNMDTDGLFIPFSGMPIMQFTGLTDSEGKEIYEGDKCDANHPDCGLFEGYIIYDDEQACFMLRTEICNDVYLYEFDEIKIIGNIYEEKSEVSNNTK